MFTNPINMHGKLLLTRVIWPANLQEGQTWTAAFSAYEEPWLASKTRASALSG